MRNIEENIIENVVDNKEVFDSYGLAVKASVNGGINVDGEPINMPVYLVNPVEVAWCLLKQAERDRIQKICESTAFNIEEMKRLYIATPFSKREEILTDLEKL